MNPRQIVETGIEIRPQVREGGTTQLAEFPWPANAAESHGPVWNGNAFMCGGEPHRVLTYARTSSNWSSELTKTHEAEAGPDHPLDVASRALATASMARIPALSPLVLDVGCSSGFLLEQLREALPNAQLIGSDYLDGPLESLAARVPRLPLLQFDLRKCPLPDACVDGVTCLNVLEHIDDDGAAMAEIHRILKVGGIAHIEVPAGPGLFDIYDEHLLHHRRYRLTDLEKLARRVGFQVDGATHIGCLVYPAFWFVKKRNRRMLGLPKAEKERLVVQQIRSTRASSWLEHLMIIETMVGKLIPYPWGIRCVVVVRKV